MRRVASAALVLFATLFSSTPALADGTRNMYPSDYFTRYGLDKNRNEHKFRATMVSARSAGNWNPFPTYGTIKVYAKAGEHIYVAQSTLMPSGKQGGKIVWRSPDGRSGEITNSDKGGRIANRRQELAGPQYGSNTGSNRYKAYKLDVTAETEGVWEIDFIGRSQDDITSAQYKSPYNEDKNVELRDMLLVEPGATTEWPENVNQSNPTSLISAFDVSVSNAADNKLIEGRVYANVLNLFMTDDNKRVAQWHSTLYMLTNTGYLYEVKPNGMNGGSYAFFGNNKGVQTGVPDGNWGYYNNGTMPDFYMSCHSGVSAYKSETVVKEQISMPIFDPRKPDNVVKTFDAVGNEVEYYEDVTHKIFFTKPAQDLPEMAKCVYGTQVLTTWLRSKENEKQIPTISDIKVVGKESGREGIYGPSGVSIYFNSSVGRVKL